jgi:hypothetical protein
MNNERNKKIEEILGSLDASQRASAPDYFYTRLKARMEKEQGKEARNSWILRPAYAFAALVLLLAVNAIIILQREEKVDNSTADNETVQSVAAEYSLNDNMTYEINQ